MKDTRKTNASGDGQVALETLQKAVRQALEKKKKLGQYAVIWHDGKPVMTGDDAPEKHEGIE